MPDFNPQEDDDKLAFQEWKQKYKKDYATPDEENTRFEIFKENLRVEHAYHPPPLGEPLWKVLNKSADKTDQEYPGPIRLDLNLLESDESDDDMPPIEVCAPVKQEDGTIRLQYFYPPSATHCNLKKFVQDEIQRQRDEKKEKEKTEKDATVKHQSTVPPVKRSSDKSDTKEEGQDGTAKRQKIGCGGQKQGCCSDCGK